MTVPEKVIQKVDEAAETGYHTEIIDLPSKGWFYPKENPLSSGRIELRYMTARDEDILTSTNLIRKGVVLDKLMKSLIVDKTINYNDLLIGDKNAIMVASRILAYGRMYDFTITCPSCAKKNEIEFDLQSIADKDVQFEESRRYINEFVFNLPLTKKKISFKLLTHGDEQEIDMELEAEKKFSKGEASSEVTTRMKKSIVSVNGNRDTLEIINTVIHMPSQDARAFREYARNCNPDVELVFDFSCMFCGTEERGIEVPIDVNFFWPKSRV